MSVATGKKLINNPSETVKDALEGFVLVTPNVSLMKQHNVVIRKDIEELKKAGKVCLISGGGSGHEPAHAGYVGEGMLTAAVCGDVFASPTSGAVLAAIRACASPSGVLLVVKNYTGDRLHFGKAAEKAKSEGIRTEMVVIGEDCALTSKDKSAGRRGLCGTIFVHKIAGAMAEGGKSLDDIIEVLNKIIKNMGTISISLSPCSVPGQKATFQIPPDEIEFGLGIHGEPGVKRIGLEPAKEIVKMMIDHLLNSEYMRNLAGKSVAIILNNLGGTSNLEMSLLSGEIMKYVTSMGIKIDRFYVGALMTSLEMAGASISLLETSEELLMYLDKDTKTSGWQFSGKVSNPSECFLEGRDVEAALKEKSKVETPNGQLIFDCLDAICKTVLENEEKLNELDRAAGDGDCGSTLSRGARAIKDHLGSKDSTLLPLDDAAQLVFALSSLLEASMGGTSGAIFSLLLTASGKGLKTCTDTLTVARALFDGIEAVKKYGAAEKGDRTMLDALCPAADALQRNASSSIPDAMKEAGKAAARGAEETVNMAAKAGRSSYIAAENLCKPDPGAVAISLIFDSIVKSLFSHG